jgi:hypothetical protein
VRAATFLLVTLLAGAQVARAELLEVISPRADGVSVTIYRDLFALITETRTVDLPEGPVTLSFDGVVETLLPESAVVSELGRGLEERNFDYDPLSPNSLLSRSIGKGVTITRTLPGSGRVVQIRATIEAANDAGIILRTALGNEALHCSGLPERLTFDEIPGDLHARPRLSVRLAAGKAGKHQIRLSYLAHGLVWKSNYVARMNAAGDRMNLTGSITLQNLTQASFRGAQVQVVAGELHLVSKDDGGTSLTGGSEETYGDWQLDEARDELQEQLEPEDSTLQLFSGCHALPVPTGLERNQFEKMEEVVVTGYRGSMRASMNSVVAESIAAREELGDYQLYRLPSATDLDARQTKQAVFLVKPRVKIARYYRFAFAVETLENNEFPTPEVTIAFDNRKSAGLGEPLPSGMVRVFQTTDAGDVFAGEANIGDRPVNLPIELGVAKALDLGLEIDVAQASTEQLRETKLDERADVELRAFNAKGVPVTLEIRQFVAGYTPDAVLAQSSETFSRKYGDFIWRLRVPANGTKQLIYRVETPKPAE